MTKTSPLSFAKNLTPEQREELYDLLHTQGETLAKGVDWCAANGVQTSKTSLSDWLKRYRLIRKVEGFDTAANELEERLVSRGVDPLLAPKLAQQGFLLQAAEAEDSETFLAMASLIQRHVEFEASKKEHDDIMRIKRMQTQQRDRALAQTQKKLEQAERRVLALEEQAAATKKIAQNAKDALKSGGMDEAKRAQLVMEMDRLILGTNAAKAMQKKEGT